MIDSDPVRSLQAARMPHRYDSTLESVGSSLSVVSNRSFDLVLSMGSNRYRGSVLSIGVKLS